MARPRGGTRYRGRRTPHRPDPEVRDLLEDLAAPRIGRCRRVDQDREQLVGVERGQSDRLVDAAGRLGQVTVTVFRTSSTVDALGGATAGTASMPW